MGEARAFGRYFEDFEIGDVYRHWPGKTITEYDDHLFCMITMNHHPLHTNAHYAETQTQFGRNVVVGNLVYSLALGMSVPDVSGKAIANLEVESLKHTAPMFHGDTLYAQTTVLDKKESSSKPDRGVLTVTAAPVPRHQRAVAALTYWLFGYAREHGGEVYPAPTDVFFSDTNVVEPDVLFVAASHLGRVGEKRIDSAPDLVVEVSSPS